MALSPERKLQLSRLTGRAVARLIGYVCRTSRIVFDPPDAVSEFRRQHPAIVAVWHGQFMLVALGRPDGVPFAAMVARHGDAEIIGEAMAKFGVELVRGAGAGTRNRDRGGSHALRAAMKALAAGKSFVMTADVPPGPARRAGEGIVTLARLSGRPIVPVAVASSRYRSLNTWSRMTINLPYSKIGYAVGSPIVVPRDASEPALEAKRREVETALNEATARAYRIAGADPRRATPRGPADPSAPPAEPGAGLKTYRSLTRLLQPAAPALLKARERAGKEDGARRGERLGQASAARPSGPLAWVHAASVGEANAVLPLIDRLQQERPSLSFLLTTGTVTSAAVAARRLGPRLIHQYLPLDGPSYVAKFLDHWRPSLAIFTESEIWPNLIFEAAARDVPLLLVNARMSNKSFGRWRRRPGVSQPLFNRFSLVVAQNEKLARRFGQLGARNVMFTGNLKVDAPPPPADAEAVGRLREALGGRPVFVAASTHPGEDAIVAAAHQRMAKDVAGLCTIIAPRHPERGAAIAEDLRALGLTVARRSLGRLPEVETDIYVADTIGELGTLYALTPVAFIGGSLVAKGGQNPIEAIRQGAGVLTGPHWQNFADSYAALLRHKGAIEVKTAVELSTAAARLLTDRTELEQMRHGADLALQVLGGGLERTLAAVLHYLPEEEGLRRAS